MEREVFHKRGLPARTARRRLAAAVFLLAGSLAGAANADKTWDRGAGTDNWQDPNNWNGNGLPTSADIMILDNSSVSPLAATMNTSGLTMTIKAIQFNTPNTVTVGNTGSGSAATSSLTLNGDGTSANTLVSMGSTASGTFTLQPNNSGGKDLSLTIANSGTMDVQNASGNLNITIGIAESAAGKAITKTGSGTLTFGGANGYTGATNINGGTLSLSSSGSIASGSTVNVGTSGTLAGAGSVLGAATLTGNGVINFSSGSIVGTLGVTGGTWAAGSTGSVGGITTVSSGTFTVNGTMTGGGVVNVSSGAKLEGTGTISKTVNINTGATVSPKGDGSNSNIGTLTTAAQTWGTTSTYIWEISSAGTSPTGAGGTFDSLSVTGTLTVSATSTNRMTIKVVSHGAVTGFSGGQPWNWNIATTGGLSGFANNKFFLDVSDFIDDNGSADPNGFSITSSGNNIRVTYVPEPGSTTLLGGAGLALLGRRRRR